MGENAVVPGDGNYVSEETIINEVFYNEVLYLPLDDIKLRDNANMKEVLESTKEYMSTLKSEKDQKALKEKVEYLEGMIEHNEDLKDVTISNMSWKDNDGDGKMDHNPKGMQVCTFERDDQVYISFRGTPARSWIDNAKAFVENLEKSEVFFNIFTFTTSVVNPESVVVSDRVKEIIGRDKVMPWDALRLGLEGKISSLLTKDENISKEKINGIFDSELKKYTSPMQEEALDYMETLKKVEFLKNTIMCM
mgnify:CR=1 FL=1